MAVAECGFLKDSLLGPNLFVIDVNDLTDNLTIDHRLYADDIKLIAPENNRMPPKARCSLVPNGQRIRS